MRICVNRSVIAQQNSWAGSLWGPHLARPSSSRELLGTGKAGPLVLLWGVARYCRVCNHSPLSFVGGRACPDLWVTEPAGGLGGESLSSLCWWAPETTLRSRVGLPFLHHYVLEFPCQWHTRASPGCPKGCPSGVSTGEVGVPTCPPPIFIRAMSFSSLGVSRSMGLWARLCEPWVGSLVREPASPHAARPVPTCSYFNLKIWEMIMATISQ